MSRSSWISSWLCLLACSCGYSGYESGGIMGRIILVLLVLMLAGCEVKPAPGLPKVFKATQPNFIIKKSLISLGRFGPTENVYEISDGQTKWKLQCKDEALVGDEVEITIKARKK